MMTIVVPMAGNSSFFPEAEHKFPKVFFEVNGRPMIQVVLERLMVFDQEIRFLFIINESDAQKYRLDNVLRLITDNNCDIILQRGLTKGAVCSILLGIDYIDPDHPLLISNADQVIDHDMNQIVGFFRKKQADGGVACFDSIHPQWSYARVGEDNALLETAEKEPISRHAIAGLYYFNRGGDFIRYAMRTIEKERSRGGLYYTSMTYNELILDNKQLFAYHLESNQYHSFYSPNKIHEYERRSKLPS